LTNETKFAPMIIRKTKTYDLVFKWVQVRTLNRTYQGQIPYNDRCECLP